jgi:hypothetical protein
MRIRVLVNPKPVDGVDLSMYRAGCDYDTDPLVAALLICEHWAIPLEPRDGRPEPPPQKTVYRRIDLI